jgi:dihydroflavonol-4-reductase
MGAPPTQGSILVTGATGFIASHIVERLLGAGRRVRGTVRSLGRPDVDLLRALPGAADRLELVEADLLEPGSFDAPIAGCAGVMHAASPYTLDVADAQRDLVDPAVKGTETVLAAAARAGSVTRVVLTSSLAAITDEPDGRVLTEADWNVKSSLTRNPYYYSKVMAERAAWAFVKERQPSFDLIVINPFAVIGPSLTPGLNVSNQILSGLLTGQFPGVLSMAWGFVDVREVAEAHVRALETPAAHGRYICAGDVLSMREVVDVLDAAGYGKTHKLPTLPLASPVATAIIKLGTYTQPKGTGQYFRTHLGRVPRYDTTKIKTELGMTFRPARDVILDAMKDLERWGHLRRPS